MDDTNEEERPLIYSLREEEWRVEMKAHGFHPREEEEEVKPPGSRSSMEESFLPWPPPSKAAGHLGPWMSFDSFVQSFHKTISPISLRSDFGCYSVGFDLSNSMSGS